MHPLSRSCYGIVWSLLFLSIIVSRTARARASDQEGGPTVGIWYTELVTCLLRTAEDSTDIIWISLVGLKDGVVQLQNQLDRLTGPIKLHLRRTKGNSCNKVPEHPNATNEGRSVNIFKSRILLTADDGCSLVSKVKNAVYAGFGGLIIYPKLHKAAGEGEPGSMGPLDYPHDFDERISRVTTNMSWRYDPFLNPILIGLIDQRIESKTGPSGIDYARRRDRLVSVFFPPEQSSKEPESGNPGPWLIIRSLSLLAFSATAVLLFSVLIRVDPDSFRTADDFRDVDQRFSISMELKVLLTFFSLCIYIDIIITMFSIGQPHTCGEAWLSFE